MDDELETPVRRALVILYDDATNTVEVQAEAFGWLEVPELLRVAMDWAEMNVPGFDYEESGSPDE